MGGCINLTEGCFKIQHQHPDQSQLNSHLNLAGKYFANTVGKTRALVLEVCHSYVAEAFNSRRQIEERQLQNTHPTFSCDNAKSDNMEEANK